MIDFAALIEALRHSIGLEPAVFFVSIIASTIIPLSSEAAILIALKLQADPLALLILSSAGSTIGVTINYFIGLKGIRGFLAQREPKKEKQARIWFKKWGAPVMFLAPTIPFIGDPLTVVAGTLKMDYKLFLLYNVAGRLAKNAVLIYLVYAGVNSIL